MNYVGQLAGQVLVTVKELYKGINQATLSGCIDVIVVKQPDGTFQCSPFHVRFGKLGVLRSREKVIDIEINGEAVDLHMKLGDNGEAFFVQEMEQHHEIVPAHLVTSPIPTEEALFRSREPRNGTSTTESGQPPSTEELSSSSLQTSSNTTGKKKKRRRRKHKAEHRKEEQSAPAGGEVELCELSSDEEANTHNGWTSSVSGVKENTDVRQHSPLTTLEWDSYPFSDGDWSPSTPRETSKPMSPKSDSELMVKPSDNLLRAEAHMQWTWGEFPESTRVSKKEKSEPKMLTITPSENTHFRVILSSEAMEAESGEEGQPADPVRGIVKPEPRTIKSHQSGRAPQPPGASAQPACSAGDMSMTPPLSGLSELSISSEPHLGDSDPGTKSSRKTRWTSSPPSRRDSGTTASSSSLASGSAAEGSSSKPNDSPNKRRSNSICFNTSP